MATKTINQAVDVMYNPTDVSTPPLISISQQTAKINEAIVQANDDGWRVIQIKDLWGIYHPGLAFGAQLILEKDVEIKS